MLRQFFLLYDLKAGKVVYDECMYLDEINLKINKDKILNNYDIDKLRLIDVTFVPNKNNEIKAYGIENEIKIIKEDK